MTLDETLERIYLYGKKRKDWGYREWWNFATSVRTTHERINWEIYRTSLVLGKTHKAVKHLEIAEKYISKAKSEMEEVMFAELKDKVQDKDKLLKIFYGGVPREA